MNKFVKEDLENLINNNISLYDEMDNSSVLITGATGLIGSILVNSIMMYNNLYNKNISVIAIAHSKSKAILVFNDYLNDKRLLIIEHDITNNLFVEEKIDFVIHTASITSSKMFVEKPVDVINTSVLGSMNIINLSIIKNVKSFVYISSIEAYGIFDNKELKELNEDELGYINISSVRSCYPESKRLVENLLVAYCSQYNLDAKVIRLSQTFGAGIDYNDNRLLAELSRCIVENKDLILHSKGETTKNFCYTVDAASAILFVLLKGKQKEIYNVASDNSIISIYELAKLMISLSNSSVNLIVKNDENVNMGYFPTSRAYLNTDKIKQLGWNSRYDIKNMIFRLIEYMKSL